MKVKELIEKKGKDVFTIRDDSSIMQAVRLFKEKRVGSLLVVDKNENILGIITERDILYRCIADDGKMKTCSVDQLMTPKEKLIIGINSDDIEYLMHVMTENRIRHVPIFDNGKIEGLISIGDIVKSLLKDVSHTNKMLMDYIEGKYPG